MLRLDFDFTKDFSRRHKQTSFRKPQKALAFTFFDFHRKNHPMPRANSFPGCFWARPLFLLLIGHRRSALDAAKSWSSTGSCGGEADSLGMSALLCVKHSQTMVKSTARSSMIVLGYLGVICWQYVVGIVYDNSFLVDSHSLGSILPTLI